MSGLLHLVQRGGDWAGPQPAQVRPRCTKCNSSLINGQCTINRVVRTPAAIPYRHMPRINVSPHYITLPEYRSTWVRTPGADYLRWTRRRPLDIDDTTWSTRRSDLTAWSAPAAILGPSNAIMYFINSSDIRHLRR